MGSCTDSIIIADLNQDGVLVILTVEYMLDVLLTATLIATVYGSLSQSVAHRTHIRVDHKAVRYHSLNLPTDY